MKSVPPRLTSDPKVPEQQNSFPPENVVSFTLPPDVPSLTGKVCAAWLAAPAGLAMVTVADPDLLGSAWETATTKTEWGLGIAAGAVYRPVVLTVPTVLLPPFVLFTSQVTAVSVVPVTVAVNCSVDLGDSVTAAGDIETATACAAGVLELLPPPQP